MLTSFFNTSKPIHYLILIISIAVLGFGITYTQPVTSYLDYLKPVLLIAVFLLFQFIVVKNQLNKFHFYAGYVFGVLLLVMLIYIPSWQTLFILLLLLLALRRLLSMSSSRSLIQKIFDAAFWITIASLLNSWAIGYIILVFVAVFMYARQDLRHWLVPILAIAAVAIISYTIDIYFDTHLISQWVDSFYTSSLPAFTHITAIDIPLIVISVTAIMSMLLYVIKISSIPQSYLSRFTLVFFTGVISLSITLFSYTLYKSNIIWLFLPNIAVYTGVIVQSRSKLWLKESLLFLPLVLLIYSVYLQANIS